MARVSLRHGLLLGMLLAGLPAVGQDRPRPADAPRPEASERPHRLDEVDPTAFGPPPPSIHGSTQPEREYQEAVRMIESGRLGHALVLLNGAVTTGGRAADPVARVYRGRGMLMQGEVGNAVREFNTALRLRKDMPEALYWRGVALRRLGMFDEAIEHIDAGLTGGYRHADSGAVRAAVLYKLGRFEEALKERDREAAARPGDPAERFARAEVLAALGRADEADRELAAAYGKAPKELAAGQGTLARLATARAARVAAEAERDGAQAQQEAQKLLWSGKSLEAAQWYARAAELRRDDPEVACAAAYAFGSAGDPASQAWYATRALRGARARGDAMRMRGAAWHRLRHCGLAAAELGLAIVADPADAAAYLERGRVYYECRISNRDAQADFNRAVELAPKDPEVWMARGTFLLEWGPAFVSTQGVSIERAYGPPAADFGKAIELDPRRTKAYVQRATALAAMGRSAAARADLSKAYELEPWDARRNARVVADALRSMRQATEFGRQLMADLAAGAEGPLPPLAAMDDGSAAAARAAWTKDSAMDNASRAGDRTAYERIKRGEGTWRDRSRYGG